MTLTRRKLIGGLGLLFAAPAIVRASSLMPVKRIEPLVDMRFLLQQRMIAAEAAMLSGISQALYGVPTMNGTVIKLDDGAPARASDFAAGRVYTWHSVGLSVAIDKPT